MPNANWGAARLAHSLLLFALLAACTSQPIVLPARPPAEYALAPEADDAFSEIETGIASLHGPTASGFQLLDRNEDGLRWRLRLIDAASHSIDLQYYLWYGDATGKLMIKHILDAADRGVRVRIVIDDLNTMISDAETLEQRDTIAALIHSHRNIELRLFNPWRNRAIAARVGESLSDLKRVNQRMHNKSLVVDNRAVIVGGRNLGDDYMGLHGDFNFHDLDVLGIGPVARQASAIFDEFWNSEWVMSTAALGLEPTDAQQRTALARLNESLADLVSAGRIPIERDNPAGTLQQLAAQMQPGTSRMFTDRPTDEVIEQRMVEVIYELLGSAQREVLITNAYIIPNQRVIDTLRGLRARGVSIRILTNSLASHDVPAVNSHYKKWRKPILETGTELYEIRHDAAIQSDVADTPPIEAGFMGLHSKAVVVDRKRAYIGSMNFDPRSGQINTEMGVIIDSAQLAETLAKLMERDMQPGNSWQVLLDPQGKLAWVSSDERVTSQPARSFWQRVQDVVFMMFPKELY